MSFSTALTTEQQQQYLQELRSEVGGTRLPQYPKIAMVNDKTDVGSLKNAMRDSNGQLLKGQFYTSDQIKDGDEYKTVNVSIGMNPEVVLLRRRYSYSFYSKTQKKLLAWTCELDDFKQQVALVNNSSGSPQLEFSGSFQDFKAYREKNYQDKEGKNVLKFRNVFYLMFNGLIHRMFVSNASITGIPPGEDHGDYKNAQAGSFLLFEKIVAAAGMHFSERVLRLGSQQKQGDSYYLMTFADAGENLKIVEAIDLRQQLDIDLKKRFAQDFGRLLAGKVESNPDVIDAEPVASEIDPADLPF